MKITENALNVLAVRLYKGVGRAWLYKNLKGGESVAQLAHLLNTASKQPQPVTAAELHALREQIRAQLLPLAACMDGVVGLGDADFPQVRGKVKNSEQPVVLFYRGDVSLLSPASQNIAVIGLLQPDDSTIEREQAMVDELLSHGAVIVSGLALGCDSVGHQQALRRGGKTVAILPSTLQQILPAQNRPLAEEIVRKGGLLLTEYYLPTRSPMEQSGRYQERDRLQALFSDAVVLTASYAKNDLGLDSGSRLAMGYARDYGITRALMYDAELDAENPKFDLNRQIIGEEPDVVQISCASRSAVAARLCRTAVTVQTDLGEQGSLFF